MEEKAIKNINTKTKDLILPAVAMRGLVCFPRFVMHFDVAREMSVKAVEAALKNDRLVFLTAQKDVYVEEPQEKDLYNIGVVAEIRQTLKTPDNVMRVLVEGLYRAKIKETVNENGMFVCTVKKLPDYSREKPDPVDLTAIMRSIKDIFETYGELVPRMPKELINSIMCQNDPYKLFENITYNMNLDFQDKQMLLEESNILSKLGMLYANIVHEVEVLEIEKQIHDEVRSNLDKNQREYYLREQMRVISSQLGEDDSQEEAYEYMDRIYEMNLAPEITEKLIREADRLLKTSSSSQESFVIRNYLDTVLELPWNTSSKTKTDIKRAARILDKDHYGLKRVKERILESIAAYAMAPEVTGQIICLAGPPGVGKTSIGKSIAKALGREYVRVSLGGVRDESDIRGHRKTYIGAMPGRIINAIKQAGTNNPLILFDEIDKMGNDFRGDPASAMLEVLDGEQNKEFRDHYIELPFDLSKVMFVTTANTTDTIPKPLLDRMELIELTSYTREEKFHIAKEHLVPKQQKKHGLKGTQIKINDAVIYDLIDYYTKEAGVRNLERMIVGLCRKAAKEIVSGNAKKVTFTSKNLESYIGAKKYFDDERSTENEIGVVNGLAWTSVGGVLMPLEVLILEGKGTIETTGSLGDVMKESAKLAVSYARSIADKYNIAPDFYKNKDIHIHAPEGAVPKDGPSAGVTMATALVSALSGIPVRCDVAMTGEITLHGKVLPIGGLREKTMAAYKAGIHTVIIPSANKGDLDEVDDAVKASTEFIFASNLEDVLNAALYKKKDDNIQSDLIIPPDESIGNQTISVRS
ncbi:endopeptidase La [Porcipelethomonas sp.]|uniref:endopeptidase La n=1 Tax=Porcipelethomonas sp. TaxID=2981675 RepID=UPI0030770182